MARPRPREGRHRRIVAAVAGTILATLTGCTPGATTEPEPSLVHLTDILETAVVDTAAVPESSGRSLDWSFGSGLPEGWKTLSTGRFPWLSRLDATPAGKGLELTLGPVPKPRSPLRIGGIWIPLSPERFDDWDQVRIRARSSDRFAGVTVAYNLDEEGALPDFMRFFTSPDEAPPLFNDGSVQTYAVPLLPRKQGPAPDELRSVAILFAAPAEASLELESVSLVPRGAEYAGPVGVRAISREGETRHSLFAHTPATITFPAAVPEGGRLDFGLAVSRGDSVTYRVRSGSTLLFEETVDDPVRWGQRTVDLSGVAGSDAPLAMEAVSERPDAVAVWGAPIVSAPPRAVDRPNVIFYVIDGGGADLMSAFGYERPTTPFLEELAREGVLFARAHSNATWTQPSTVSFMTSLQHSVLGGLRRGVHSTAVPPEAVTMAERFRQGGYQTASFTANPNAGRIIGLERGVDVMRDVETEKHSTSSEELEERFWAFRDSYPGGPTWVHFQTTDVHEPNEPVPPYAGRFVSPEQAEQEAAWDEKLWEVGGPLFGTTSIDAFYTEAMERARIDRKAYFEARKGLYDETMLHQDEQLRRLVESLKQRGEWERTLLVIGSDHGHPAGTFARFGRGLFDPQPEPWEGAMCDAYATRVPLLVVWPGHIDGGRRVDTPVSMIDVLPTLLELTGLPAAEVAQGRSLVPLLEDPSAEHPPVVLDEFRVDEATGELVGNLEIVEGRWGASMEIAPIAEGADPRLGRHAVPAGGRWGAVHPYFGAIPRLLLYDLESDPFALSAVNEEHPDEVMRFERLLLHQWEAHRSLAQRFGQADEKPLSPDQLEQLRALGYIR